MIFYALLAFFNGIVVSTGRSLNGQLSASLGPLKTSFWNHLVGFAFISMILIASTGFVMNFPAEMPFFAYAGGVFGALFVVISSFVFPRLGAMSSAVLVISGEMVASLFLDSLNTNSLPTFGQIAGGALVLFGMFLSRKKR